MLSGIGSALRGRQCLDPERVNVGLDEVAERIINHSMAMQTVYALKNIRNNRDIEMSLAIACTLVPGVQVTLVFDQEFRWIEMHIQRLAYH
jgi:hypothetical protein